MKIHSLEPQKNYELIDSGNGYKLERFGRYKVARPDPNAIWSKKLSDTEWKDADAVFDTGKENSFDKVQNKLSKKTTRENSSQAGLSRWQNRSVESPWIFEYNKIKMLLKLSPFKHVGLFPEQISNWEWMGESLTKDQPFDHAQGKRLPPEANQPKIGKTKDSENKINVLNLFGYTGGATLHCASLGAKVTHVDASIPAVNWAKENQKLSGLESASIRWIVDDAIKFVTREIKRGVKYDAVIMDPPSFGRDQKGKVFKFENDVPTLIELVKKVLVEKPLFVIINGYSMGYSPTVMKNMLAEILPIEKIECGELQIRESGSKRSLPCSVFARYSNEKG